MKITVVGTGYVGLVTGTCLAETGNEIVCVDNNAEKVQKMRNGIVPIYEPHLDVLFDRNIEANRLTFTTDLKAGLDHGEVIFLALPTPEDEDGSADLSYVLGVAKEIGDYITDYKVIVDKSTVPVGTAEKVTATIAKTAKAEFDVVSNPEFLREGFAVDDFLKPERIVIGTESPKAAEIMKRLYKPYVRSGNPILVMDEKSAELTKYAANSFLATKITFMNEIANICEKVGADVDNVRRGIGTDSRIGKRFLFAGIGYGGSCFPKDVQAIHYTAARNDYDFKILDSVMKVNGRQKLSIVDKVKSYYGDSLKGKTIGIWGLSFKPETDDIREAPSLYITEALAKEGVKMKAYDPEAIETFKVASSEDTLKMIDFKKDRDSVLEGIDALIICTEWNEFRRPDFENFKNQMKAPVIFDGRNLYSLERAEEAGLTYFSVGRRTIGA